MTRLKAPANNVEQLRLQLGWSQADLAREAGLNPRTIARVEKAEKRFAKVTYFKILKAFNKGRRDQDLEPRLDIGEVFPNNLDVK